MLRHPSTAALHWFQNDRALIETALCQKKKFLKKLMFLDQIYTFRLHFSDNSQRHMYFTTGIGLAISSTQRTV